MKNPIWIWRFTIGGLFMGCLLTVALCAWKIDKIAPTLAEAEHPFILIDPGHGGEDGGAQGADGTQEKTINLAISLPLADMLRVCGYEVHMTRTTDISIHDAHCDSFRKKKVSDMHNRLAQYDRAVCTISIHQNQFSQAKYDGTQVFYATSRGESMMLATAIRECVITQLQPKNTRELKKGTENIFLLHATKMPAVLVECGFLSNAEELEKLKSGEYQQKMAFAIAGGVMRYAP